MAFAFPVGPWRLAQGEPAHGSPEQRLPLYYELSAPTVGHRSSALRHGDEPQFQNREEHEQMGKRQLITSTAFSAADRQQLATAILNYVTEAVRLEHANADR